MAAEDGATPASLLDDPWEDYRDGGERPDAVEDEATRANAAALEDGAACERGAAEDPDAR
jgi:hypothetical protein